MKRLVLIISAILSLATLQAQTVTDGYLTDGDIVSISTIYSNERYYLEASTSGIQTRDNATDNCLWQIGITKNGDTFYYTFKDLTTGKYISINERPNNPSYSLQNNPTVLRFQREGGENNKQGICEYGKLYHYFYYSSWWRYVSIYFAQGGWNPFRFTVSTSNEVNVYIEKWELKGAGKPTGHFNPSKIEFTYAENINKEQQVTEQVTNVEFMIEATTESYYQCVNRTEEALLRRQTNDVNVNNILIKNIYWESDSVNKGKSSILDVRKYVAHQDENRTLMTVSDPETTTGGEQKTWQFTVTPYGNSPMGLKDKFGTLERWIDYADNVIVEYTYGTGEVQKAEMRVVRKAYHEEQLPTISFSINPVTYTYSIEEETKQFDVTLTHQHGSVIYNVDHQAIDSNMTYQPVHVNLRDFDEKFTAADGWEKTYRFNSNPADPSSHWLTVNDEEFQNEGNLYIKAETNGTGQKRSDTLIVTLNKTGGEHQHAESFKIPLSQRGQVGGIQLLPNIGKGNTALGKNPYDNREEQQVHTAERTIYYLPNQEIELRLPESGYSGYMRWYDYETNGDPYYNENPVDSTDWIRSPRAANGNAFSAINTPRNALEATIQQEGVSLGLYAINKASGGVLDEGNPSNPAPILKGWNYNPNNPDTAHHIMACDVSAYTDYRIVYNKTNNTTRIDTIQEPTLSYRQLFHLRPASEMADTLAARSNRGEYLENYKYQAPAGKQILLSTEYRHSKVRSHESELCYFYKDNGGNVHRIDNRQGNMLKWYVSEKNGSNRQEYTPRYSAEMDYLIVRSDNYTYDAPKVYTLELPEGKVGNATPLLIAKFEVEFVDIERQGPTNKTIITQQRIETQYRPLAEINFDNQNNHLNWEEASYGYVYTTGNLAQDAYFKRGATQGAFPFYGEYTILSSVNKDWAQATAHGGQGKSLYVDGTMEPGLVASITASGQICSGQTMYCSAWFCNPAPSGWSGEGNPIFRCNIQGKNDNETEWHDVGVYFVGELLKGTSWQQVVFPIQSKESYDRIRVSIYNFATTNQGNDFMVDDINLFVSQLPIAAYQGEMACRSIEDGETTAAAVLRLDYNNITAGSDGYMFYQIFNETFTRNDTTGFPVILTGDAAYYHDYDVDHGEHDHDHPYGSVHIPEQGFDPEAENSKLGTKTYSIASSVSSFLDSLVLNNLKHGKAYIKTNNDGATKWLLYVAHIVNNTTVEADALAQLYEPHNYVMRMAYTPEELPTAACNLTTPLHATQKTEFQLRNSAKEVILHDAEGRANNSGDKLYFSAQSSNNCANDLYFLTSTVINHMALETGGTPVDIAAPIYSDWLIGDPAGDVLSEQAPVRKNYETDDEYTAALAEYNNRLQASIEGFKDMYGGYTHDQVATAIMYDMRRVPTSKDNNPNYTARTFQELDRNAFLSHQNYEIVRHLYENGWLQLCDTTVHFYLGSRLNKKDEIIGDTVRYWCFPIEGTAKKTVKVDGVDTEITLKDCNEPHRVMVSITGSNYYYNITPIAYADKTPQQSVQLPTLKVLEGSTSITFPVTELGGGIKTAGQTDDGKTITLNLADATYINLETGETYSNPSLAAGNKYTIRLTLVNNQTSAETPLSGSCRYGYAFLNLEIVPKTLVWQPAETAFNGWGKNENWKGWVDSNRNDKIDEGEICNGYVPMEEADVIIPNIDNDLLYPYIVPEHEHSHYPMTINADPHHCKNIYFAPGAKIHNQHLLDYEKAFVDMQITAGGWNMVSAPMKGMVSGDMFIPHDGMYYEDSADKIEEPNPFVVSDFQGTRSTNAVYAFWEGFYNTTVEKMTNNGVVDQTASAEFISSNTLAQPLTPGTGYHLWGEGQTSQEALTIRLPKPDTKYDYYTREQPNGQSVNIPQNLLDVRGQLAFESSHDVENDPMTITLTNAVSSKYFLFGNPTMAYIDMHALFVDNNTTWTGSFQRMENSILMPVAQLTMAEDRYLPPMTSALLECSEANTSMTIELKPSHLTLNNLINPTKQADGDNTNSQSISARRVAAYESERPENEDAQATEMLTIYALTENAHARTVLATNPIANDYYQVGEDALFISTGVENQSVVTSPLNMYTVAEQVPMMADVRQGISEIPLGILAASNARSQYMQVAFYLSANWSRECYFCDTKTGQKIRIMNGLIITVEMPLNHEQRYYIEGPDTYQGSNGVVTSTTQPSVSNTGNKVWAYAPDRSNVVVSSTDLIKSATLYDITGRLVASSSLNSQLSTINSQLITNTLTLHTTGTAGVYIVDVTLRDGSTEQAQVIIQ